MIYRLRYDRENFLVFYISPHEIGAKLGNPFVLRRNPISAWKENWKPLSVEFADESDKKDVTAPPDITVWFTDNLVLNQRAYQALQDTLSPYGEFLPVHCEGIEYWVLHITKCADPGAIDEKNSARHIDESSFINLERLAFNEDKLSDVLLFRTEYTGYRNIYCTEKFKTLIEGAGLKGLLFTDDLTQQREP